MRPPEVSNAMLVPASATTVRAARGSSPRSVTCTPPRKMPASGWIAAAVNPSARRSLRASAPSACRSAARTCGVTRVFQCAPASPAAARAAAWPSIRTHASMKPANTVAPAPSCTVVPAGISNEPRAPTRSIHPSFRSTTPSASRSPGVGTTVTFTIASRRASTGRIATGGASWASATAARHTAPADANVGRARAMDTGCGAARVIRAFHTDRRPRARSPARNGVDHSPRSRSRPSMAARSFSGDS